MRRNVKIEILFIAIFGLAIFYQIFIPPIVGLADNGDFARIIDKVGILPGPDKQYLGNINLVFQIDPKFTLKGYQSSELIFVYASILLNGILSKDGQYYLLIIAGIHCIALLVCMWLVVRGIQEANFRAKWVIYFCLLLFFTDVGYIAYLNSLYSEPASMIFLTLVLGIVFLIIQKISQGKFSIFWLLAFFVASFLFVVAKPQNAVMGVFLAYLGYRIYQFSPLGEVPRKTYQSIAWGLTGGLIAISFLFFAFGLPRYYRSGDLWNSVFLEIVGRSSNPVQELEELGLSPEMVIYQGTYAFSEGVNRADYEEFQHSWLYFRILKYYIVHPDRLVSLIDNTTSSAFELQPENLGNFLIDHPSYEKSKSFAVWNDLRFAVLPKSIWTLVGWLVINILTLAIKIRKYDRTVVNKILSNTHLTIVAMAVFQYLTVVMAEGTFELIKHMFLFNLLFDVSLIFLLSYGYSLLIQSLRQPIPSTAVQQNP